MDLCKRLQLEHFGNLDAAELAGLAEIVAQQVGDHDELGDFLLGCLEFKRRAAVLVRIGETRAGALDRAGLDAAAGDLQKRLRRGTEHFLAAQ